MSSARETRVTPHKLTLAEVLGWLVADGVVSADKAQLLQWVVRDLGDASPGIESRPGVCGGEPCIVRTRIPVWVLEQSRRHARICALLGRVDCSAAT